MISKISDQGLILKMFILRKTIHEGFGIEVEEAVDL